MGSIEVIEEYRALAVREAQRAAQAEATLVALALQTGADLIGNASLEGAADHSITPEMTDEGLKLTLAKKEKKDA